MGLGQVASLQMIRPHCWRISDDAFRASQEGRTGVTGVDLWRAPGVKVESSKSAASDGVWLIIWRTLS